MPAVSWLPCGCWPLVCVTRVVSSSSPVSSVKQDRVECVVEINTEQIYRLQLILLHGKHKTADLVTDLGQDQIYNAGVVGMIAQIDTIT